MKQLLSYAATAAFLLSSCQAPPAGPEVTVENAWVRLPAVAGRPGAAYFTLRTNNDPTSLTGISSPRAERIELHSSSMTDGVMRMGPITPEEATFGDSLVFEPGGKHAMLFGIDPALKPGDTIPLTLTFDPAPPVTIKAEVRGPGGMENMGH